jgi:hypothetical protein
MALSRIAGSEAPFFVPLLLAFATLAVVYAAASHVSSAAGGLLAAGLLAVNPVFVDLAIQPMSDVPATFWLITAAWLRLIRRRLPVIAGMCGGMAMLTRPALLPAVLILAVVSARRSRETLWFFATFGIFVIAQLVLNQTLYGGAAASGYGPAGDLFQAVRIAANIRNYIGWITYSHTILFWVLCVIGIVALRREPWAWAMLAVAAGVVFPYLFYLTFTDWESPRFLLPALAIVTLVAAVGITRVMAAGLGRVWCVPALILLVCAGAYWAHGVLRQQHVFELSVGEAKYPLVGQRVHELTPANAVVFSALHSGTIRYYGARDTVRWDVVPAGALQSSVARLRELQRPTFLVLDVPGEEELFRRTFAADLSALELTIVARVREVEIFQLMPRRPN